MFSLKESALGHAKAAERLVDDEAVFLNRNKEVAPVFINLLFQSVEITLKAFATETGLATEKELRDREITKNGHGIFELANLINSKLEDIEVIDLLLPMRGFADSNDVLMAMVYDDKFKPSRDSYVRRNITYAQLKPGDLQVVVGVKGWVEAIRKAAENLDHAVLNYSLQSSGKIVNKASKGMQ